MNNIHLLSSDLDQDLLFLDNLKKRDIGQQFNYMGEYAEIYCARDKRQLDGSVPTPQDLKELLKSQFRKASSTAVISVGCADGDFEKRALDDLHQEGYSFTYYGLDYSKAMLDLGVKTFANSPYGVHLLFGDFMSPIVSREILNLTNTFSNRIFLFLGSTIGNLNQSAAIDSLYNILRKDEAVILEAGIRNLVSKEEDLKIFKRCKERLQDKEWMELYFGPLNKIGIPYSNGRMALETSTEDAVESFKATFCFKITKATEINYRGEIIHLLPGEKIKLIDIHMYHPDTLVANIEARGFILEEKILRGRRGIYSFTRKK